MIDERAGKQPFDRVCGTEGGAEARGRGHRFIREQSFDDPVSPPEPSGQSVRKPGRRSRIIYNHNEATLGRSLDLVEKGGGRGQGPGVR